MYIIRLVSIWKLIHSKKSVLLSMYRRTFERLYCSTKSVASINNNGTLKRLITVLTCEPVFQSRSSKGWSGRFWLYLTLCKLQMCSRQWNGILNGDEVRPLCLVGPAAGLYCVCAAWTHALLLSILLLLLLLQNAAHMCASSSMFRSAEKYELV